MDDESGDNRNDRRVRWIGAVVVLAAVAGGVILALDRDRQAAPAAVVVAVADRGPVTLDVATTGTVEPATTRSLSFGVGGTVATIPVRPGNRVVKGQQLATLDGTDTADAVTDAAAQLTEARTRLATATAAAVRATASATTCARPTLTRGATAAAVPALTGPASIDLAPAAPELRVPAHPAPVRTAPTAANPAATVPATLAPVDDIVIGAEDAPAALPPLRRLPVPATLATVPATLAPVDDIVIGADDAPAAFPPLRPLPAARNFMKYPHWEGKGEPGVAERRASPGEMAGGVSPGEVAGGVVAEAAPGGVEAAGIAAAGAETATPCATQGFPDTGNDSVLSAEQQVNRAARAVQQAAAARAGISITAPIAGTVVAVSGSVGDQVRAGAGFVTLADTNRMQVRADFPEADAGALAIGQAAVVTLADADTTREGRVVQVDPAGTSDGTLVRYGALVSFTDSPTDLLVGQSARVRVRTGEVAEALRVPSTAVHDVSTGAGTVLLRSGGRSSERLVTVGLRGDQYTEILDGLTEGDQVVRSW